MKLEQLVHSAFDALGMVTLGTHVLLGTMRGLWDALPFALRARHR